MSKKTDKVEVYYCKEDGSRCYPEYQNQCMLYVPHQTDNKCVHMKERSYKKGQMKMKLQMKFPCGFEFNINTGWWYDITELPDICPMHGKKCRTTVVR